jgi:transposase
MKRKQEEYLKALELRRKGISIKKIAKIVGVSVSSISYWCRSIELTEKQKAKLNKRTANIKHLRRLARLSHLEKVARVRKITKEAILEVKILKERELFLTGLALYWAEGFKSAQEQRLGFCNSDPRMIKFMVKWFKKSLKIKTEDFILRTEFNVIHKDREDEIKDYWAKITGLPLDQFEKSFYQHSVWKRDYTKRDPYFGVLRIRIRKSSLFLNKTRGWIQGLSKAI